MNGTDAGGRTRFRGPGPGCFLKGCLTLFIVAMLLGVILGATGWYVVTSAQPFVSALPGRIRIFPATDAQYQAVLARAKPFNEALEAGQPASLTLTAEDLNVLVARDPGLADVRGGIYFALVQNRLVVDVSAPVDNADLGSAKGYFIGRLIMDASISDGTVAVVLRGVEQLNGQAPPTFIERIVTGAVMSEAFEQDVRTRLEAQGAASAYLRRLHTARIEGDHIVITSGNAPPPDQPTPVPGVVAARPLRQ